MKKGEKMKKSKTIIGGEPLPNIPWEDKPKGCIDVVWRYSGNPILDWNPIPKAARIFNSAVLPYNNEFVGVFRADQRNGRATLFFGKSKDGLKWEIGPDPIRWLDENGKPNPISYGYDPRFVKLDDTYYVVWCDDMHGASIGLGKTKDFKTFIRMPNPLMPFNRNGVLFPKKINGKYILLSRPSEADTLLSVICLSVKVPTLSIGEIINMLWAEAEAGGGRAQKSAQAQSRLKQPKGGCCSTTAYLIPATASFTASGR
jgi:predicted GH43/DUF377 family glycosyl hydrolase